FLPVLPFDLRFAGGTMSELVGKLILAEAGPSDAVGGQSGFGEKGDGVRLFAKSKRLAAQVRQVIDPVIQTRENDGRPIFVRPNERADFGIERMGLNIR